MTASERGGIGGSEDGAKLRRRSLPRRRRGAGRVTFHLSPPVPMRRLALPLFFLCVLGCEEPPDAPNALTDDLGRSVEVTEQPERVLSLAPNLTELLFAIG